MKTPLEQLLKALAASLGPKAPPEPVKVERTYTIEVRVTATEADDARIKHNVAQHATALSVLAQEINPDGKVVAYGWDFFAGHKEIAADAARLEDCTFAKALDAMPFEAAVRIVLALLKANKKMVAHPGIMGWTKRNAQLVAAAVAAVNCDAMRYSKRDYDLFASTIKEAREIIADPGAIVALAHIAGRLASKFQADNPAFDMECFVKACGFNGKE